jgi:hypothetical protein
MTYAEQERFIKTAQITEDEIEYFMVPFTQLYQERLRSEALHALHRAESLLRIAASFDLTQETIDEETWRKGLAIHRRHPIVNEVTH